MSNFLWLLLILGGLLLSYLSICFLIFLSQYPTFRNKTDSENPSQNLRPKPPEWPPFITKLLELQQRHSKLYAADEEGTISPERRKVREEMRRHIASATESDLEQMVLLRISQMDPDERNESPEEILEMFRTHRAHCTEDPDPAEP